MTKGKNGGQSNKQTNKQTNKTVYVYQGVCIIGQYAVMPI